MARRWSQISLGCLAVAYRREWCHKHIWKTQWYFVFAPFGHFHCVCFLCCVPLWKCFVRTSLSSGWGKWRDWSGFFFFLCLRQLFQAYFCPCGRIPTGLCPRGCSSITEIKFNECPFDSPSFISNILITGQGQGFVVMALMQTPKQPKSKQWTSCNRVIQDIHSVDLIALKSSPSDRTAQS